MVARASVLRGLAVPRATPTPPVVRGYLVAVFLATLLVASSTSLVWSLAEGPTPGVAVAGGVAVEVGPRKVIVVATAPECSVELRTAEGSTRPSEIKLELVNIGEGSEVTGLAGREAFVREGRSARAIIYPALGWPRLISTHLPGPSNGTWSFIAMGDPQGHDWNVEAAGAIAGATGSRFLLLLGDVTASGLQEQYASLGQALNSVGVPVYATPGNHDRMNRGGVRFKLMFGATQSSFSYGGVRFAVPDTSNNTFGEQERSDLERMTGDGEEGRLVVATHTSPVDPRPGADHTYVNQGGSGALMTAVELAGASLLLTGHVHLYCSTATAGGVPLVLTGGGGGTFHGPGVDGEYHHILKVTVHPDRLEWEVLPLTDERVPRQAGDVSVRLEGAGGEVASLMLGQLVPLAVLEGCWSFENRYGNWAPAGTYGAVPMDTLLSLVGGMGADDVVEVRAIDGYVQRYSYSNVRGTGDVVGRQGQMALAISLDGILPPVWQDGPRIIFTPADGAYSNLDAMGTTATDQWSDPMSGGVRWVRDVAVITVIG